jgi:hypothetical protein
MPLDKGKIQADTLKGTVRIEVLSASESEFVFAWTWATLEHSGQGRVGHHEPGILADLLDGQRIEFALSRDGSALSLRNYDAVRPRLEARLEQVVDSRRPRLGENPVLEGFRRDFLDLIRTPAAAADVLLQDPQTLLGCLIGRITAGEQVHAPAELPNPFGGPAFPAEANVAVVDLPPGKASIAWRVTPRGSEMAGVMAETVRRMEIRAGRRKKVPRVMSLSLRSEGEATITLGSTWPVEGRVTYTLSADGTRETTTTVWKLRGSGATPPR